jgi:O-antigen ligase
VSTIEAAVLFIALIATFSRSTYLMLAITFILYYVLRRNWKGLLLLTLGGILIASIYFIPRAHIDKAKRIDRELSANLRLLSYMHAVTLFNDHPVLGVGYDLIRYEKNARYMVYDLKEGGHSGAGFESSWLTILATTGVIGTLVYAAYWLTTLFTIIEPAKASAQNLLKNTHAFILKGTVQEHLVASLLVGWFAHAWFVNSLLYPYLLIIWAIIVGTVLAKK